MSSTILENHAHFDPQVVKDTLNVFAQLIDWNDLQYFESMVKACIQFLQPDNNTVPKYMKNGAFNCVQAVVSKGMDYP